MLNIFDKITGQLPKSTLKVPLAKPAVQLKEIPLKDIIARWQKNPTQQDTRAILQRMDSTITAALKSYAPGHLNDLKTRAASLLLNTLKTYNPAAGTLPSTYAFYGLKRLNRLAAERYNIIEQPLGARLQLNFLNNLVNEYKMLENRLPSYALLADKTGISEKRIKDLLLGNTVVSDSSTLSELTNLSTFSMPGLTDNDYFEYVYKSSNPIDQKIMEWTAGAHSKKALSNNEIAQKLGISAAAVSQRKSAIQDNLARVRELI